MWWTALAGTILGALNANKEQQAADGQRKVEVVNELWSPWTGRHGRSVENANWMARMGQGFTSGLGMGQNMVDAKSANTQPQGSSWTGQNNTQVNPSAMGGRG